jgi:hypothetical protein
LFVVVLVVVVLAWEVTPYRVVSPQAATKGGAPWGAGVPELRSEIPWHRTKDDSQDARSRHRDGRGLAPAKPDPADYNKHHEPHDRGAILLAAVFDAFLSIYKGRVADLLRIATEGTGAWMGPTFTRLRFLWVEGHRARRSL